LLFVNNDDRIVFSVSVLLFQLLASVGAYNAVLERLPFMENKLSQLLNGIRIVRQERQHSHVSRVSQCSVRLDYIVFAMDTPRRKKTEVCLALLPVLYVQKRCNKNTLCFQVMADDYEVLLNKLLNSLRRCQEYVTQTFGHADLSDLEIVVDA
jgi:hypothetical protein